MELAHVSWAGPAMDDPEIAEALPSFLGSSIAEVNGFIQFGGGLHVRGACFTPGWHSLRHAWHGTAAFHRLYPTVAAGWVPFAEDCMGDQFFLAGGTILRLLAETGKVEDMACDLASFLKAANETPVEFLSLEPLLELQRNGSALAPGELIHAYPPFCTVEAENGMSLRAVPALELHAFHAAFARHVLNEGDRVRMNLTD
jgi:hypothetical protein